jgi:hypothetical protein
MVRSSEEATRLAALARTATRRSVNSARKLDKSVPEPLSRLAGRVAIQSPIIIESPVQNLRVPRSGRAQNPLATLSSTKNNFKSPAVSNSVRLNTKAPKRTCAQPCNEKTRITGRVKPPTLAERFAELKVTGVKGAKKPAHAATKPAMPIIKKSVEKESNHGAMQATIIAVAKVAARVVEEEEEETTMVAAIMKVPANTTKPEFEERVCVSEKNDEDDLMSEGEKEEEGKPTLHKTPASVAIGYTFTAASESYEEIARKAQAVDKPTAVLETVEDVLLNVEKKAEATNNFLTSFELKMAAMKKAIMVAPALPEEIKTEEKSEEAKQEAKMYNTKYRFQLEGDDAEASLLFDYDVMEPSFIFPLPENIAWEGKYTETETREAQAPDDHRQALDFSRECLSLDNPRPSRIPGPSEPIPEKPRKHVTKVKLETFKMISGGWWLHINKSFDEDSESKQLCRYLFFNSHSIQANK